MASAAAVWLGYPGEMVEPSEAPDIYATRIGGRPVYPAQQPPPAAAAAPRCAVCGGPLSLVMQAYAPVLEVQQRSLLLWGCCAVGCGRQPGAWLAQRWQLPPPQPPPLQSPEQPWQPDALSPTAASSSQGLAVPQVDADDDGFGDLGDWGATGDPGYGSSFDFSDLSTALQEAGQQQLLRQQQQAGSKKGAAATSGAGPGAAEQQQEEQQEEEEALMCCRGPAGPLLPEFHVVSEVEPPEAPGAAALPRSELAHIQQLLAEYEAAEAGGPSPSNSSSGAGQGGSSSSSSTRAVGGGEGGEGPEAWGGEGYEADAARGVTTAWLKFSKRLGRAAAQCARYCWLGPLLWPLAAAPQVAPCGLCGAGRACELQVMPALVAAVEEAGAWLGAGQGEVSAAVAGAGDWEWATIAVFTCTASCGQVTRERGSSSSSAGLVLVEEVVAVALEQQCHTAPATMPAAPPPEKLAALGIQEQTLREQEVEGEACE